MERIPVRPDPGRRNAFSTRSFPMLRTISYTLTLAVLGGVAVSVEAQHPEVHGSEPTEHTIMGIVKVVDATHVEVETQDGHSVTAQFEQDTRVLRGTSLVSLTDIKVGERIVVIGFGEMEHLKAMEVRLASAGRSKAPAKAQHPEMHRRESAEGQEHEEHDSRGRATEVQALEPHERMGSGTSWQPDDSPMFAFHTMRRDWMITTHGLVFAVYDRQSGPRGDTRLVAPNWFMAMARRQFGRGETVLRGMFSLDPATVRPRGYPQLFQTGEVFRGRPLVDAQHPHDLFMELAASHTFRLADTTGFQVYVAPVGEPALGPVAFPHRASAAEIPVAVLGHHLQDSTHIAFGVLTAGLIHRNLKIDGSWFNGREPDEKRWGFDPIRLNSYSGRVSYRGGRRWVFQVSRGWLESPEELSPGQDVTRTTASVLHARSRASWDTTAALIWGRNREKEAGTEGDTENSLTLEASLTFKGRNHLFGRAERVDRTGLVDISDPESDPKVTVTALSIGAGRDLLAVRGMPLALSALVTAYEKDDVLDPIYGDNPMSFYLYLRLRAPRMEQGTMDHAASPKGHETMKH